MSEHELYNITWTAIALLLGAGIGLGFIITGVILWIKERLKK